MDVWGQRTYGKSLYLPLNFLTQQSDSKKKNKVYQKSKRRKVFETDLYLGKGWEKGEPALRYLLTIFFALETIFSFPFKEMQMKRKQDKIICKRTYIPSGVTLLPLKNPLLLIHH